MRVTERGQAARKTVGLTGTKTGPTDAQVRWFASVLGSGRVERLHHGACIGVDAQMHRLALDHFSNATHQPIVVHPPIDQGRVDPICLLESALVKVLPPNGFLLRNRDIVDATQLLIALPDGPERLRSGTWSTVRYARRLAKPVVICYPDGEVARERLPRAA